MLDNISVECFKLAVLVRGQSANNWSVRELGMINTLLVMIMGGGVVFV